ncbi:MAG: hypothetical protein N2V74_00980 [Candidatus Methanospirare jalkutatii]|nr:MAG: hypothetical protein N2V74_04880 [Candidatus Methanospirare jalkutatii]UYZ40301.1 MAG: hypothetical protein N2V74_00980 [Candidatus Methanospirare jalkutatii]
MRDKKVEGVRSGMRNVYAEAVEGRRVEDGERKSRERVEEG